MFVYSHNENSQGAKALAKALGGKRIRHEGSAFVGNKGKFIVNWGSQKVPEEVGKSTVLNSPDLIAKYSNKLRYFQHIASINDGPRIPAFTTSPEEAKEWAKAGKLVVARTVLSGSGGEGINIIDYSDPASFVEAPLYTEYVKKKDEYRIHFVNGEIVDYQRKALRPGTGTDHVNWQVRNLDNGFIYVRNDVELPKDVRDQALKAISSCELDFGAIDIIYQESSGKGYVLEINSAPGLQGETVNSYANALKKLGA